ncbi:MAG: NYN domain-containing protein [Calditrichia bacterium]
MTMEKSQNSKTKNYFPQKVAVLIDGGFFLKRYNHCYGKNNNPEKVANDLFTMCLSHVENDELYRIFYYDCPPLAKKAHNPISKELIDFSKSEIAQFKYLFFEELKKKRKLALRLGVLKDRGGWRIWSNRAKELYAGKIAFNEISAKDVYYDIVQKGVDIRIGIDIASLAFKKQVNKIILVSGDSDFVPAAKLARREGIDFVLDPMWQKIERKLFEHIDGLISKCPKPKK